MNRTESRPFTLFDAVVLVAATAASFAWSRDVVAARAINSFDAWTLSNRPEGRGRAVNLVYYRTEHAVPPIAGRWCRFAAYLTQRLALCPCPTLAAWTLAIFVLTLLRARPLNRRVLSRPGVVASAAFIVAFAGGAAVFLVEQPKIAGNLSNDQSHYEPRSSSDFSLLPERASNWTAYGRDWWVLTWFSLPRKAALAVAVSWLALAMSGRWRMGLGWRNRWGVTIGACWIFVGSLSLISSWLAVFAR
jgi:hypothetical protein